MWDFNKQKKKATNFQYIRTQNKHLHRQRKKVNREEWFNQNTTKNKQSKHLILEPQVRHQGNLLESSGLRWIFVTLTLKFCCLEHTKIISLREFYSMVAFFMMIFYDSGFSSSLNSSFQFNLYILRVTPFL